MRVNYFFWDRIVQDSDHFPVFSASVEAESDWVLDWLVAVCRNS